MTGTVPVEWTNAMSCLHDAMIERDGMKTATGMALDETTDRYVRAVDGLVDHLAALRDRKVLGEITLLMAKRARS